MGMPDRHDDTPDAPASPVLSAEEALDRINRMRSNVVMTQRASWSNMLYPLVAILDAAGYECEGATDEQRAGKMPTLLDHTPMPDDILGSIGDTQPAPAPDHVGEAGE